jgi:hypothetical protein
MAEGVTALALRRPFNRGPEGGDVMATKKKPLSHPVVVLRQICSRSTAESHLRVAYCSQ